jgi:exopolysaccharide biosynthesis protein
MHLPAKPLLNPFRLFVRYPSLKIFLPLGIAGIGLATWLAFSLISLYQTQQTNQALLQEKETLTQQLSTVRADLDTLLNEDQYKKNQNLVGEIKNIHTTFSDAVDQYERTIKLRESAIKTQEIDALFTKILLLLSDRNFSSASAQLKILGDAIGKEEQKLLASIPIPSNVPQIQTAPATGYQRQSVQTEHGTFLVDVIGADLGSTKVQVETASSGDCRDGCPVSSLADFVSRSGGFAGINGPYFCPAEYPSCAGKTNSFDTLLMNKDKTYFNSDNNVYSTVPAVIFSPGSARFVGQSLEWGRDTGVDAVIASQPMLLSGGEIRFDGDGDPKKGSRGSRSFIGTKDNTVYIGVVRGATVAEVAFVLKTMGLHNALNLDSGGSTAFMVNGKYIAGPGRNTPFGIVLVRR